jgi:hypothetical protein
VKPHESGSAQGWDDVDLMQAVVEGARLRLHEPETGRRRRAVQMTVFLMHAGPSSTCRRSSHIRIHEHHYEIYYTHRDTDTVTHILEYYCCCALYA